MKQIHNTMDTESLRRRGLKACGTRFIKAALVVAMVLATMSVSAQDVIVTVTKMRPTLPSSLVDLMDHPEQTVRVMLQNTTGHDVRVYLKMSLTSDYVTNGEPMSLTTQEKGNTRPYIVVPPSGMTLSFMDISDHFAGRLTTNLTTSFLQLTRIPEGNYSLCFEAYPWYEQVLDDGEPMSRQCADFTVCYTASAPELITPVMAVNSNAVGPKPVRVPKKGKDGFVEARDPNTVQPARQINIRWTEVITNCAHTSKINYTLKIVRVAPSLSPDYAIDHAPVVFSKNCGVATFCQIDTLRDLQYPFERGATYAVQVQAQERSANPTLEIANSGKSQIITFTWGKAAYNVGNNNGNNNQQGNTAEESSTETSGKDDILASLRQSYFVYPYRDATTYNTVHAKFSDEANQVLAEDKSVQVKYKGSYDGHIVSPKMSPFDIKWMPVRGNNLKRVRYTVKLYEDLGELVDLSTRTPLASKNFDINAEGDGNYLTSIDPMSLGDTTWLQYMQQGKKFVVSVVADADYRYFNYKINKTVHMVNGIEADTEYDTVTTTNDETVRYTSTMNFQWGIDSALLDRVLPPQFTGPINRSTASWDDTSFMHFEPTVENLWYTDNFNLSWKKASNLDIVDEDTALYNVYIYEAVPGLSVFPSREPGV